MSASRTVKTPAARARERLEVAERMSKRADAKRDTAYKAFRAADKAQVEANARVDHARKDPDLPKPLQAVEDTP